MGTCKLCKEKPETAQDMLVANDVYGLKEEKVSTINQTEKAMRTHGILPHEG